MCVAALSFCLSFYLSVCLSVCLCVRVRACVYACLIVMFALYLIEVQPKSASTIVVVCYVLSCCCFVYFLELRALDTVVAPCIHALAPVVQILENEVKILRNESRTKDETLSKMMIKKSQAINIRDQVGELQ